MNLANGRSYLAIPGPSVIPDRVLQAMHRASPNIYEGELHALTLSIYPDLKRVARTRHHAAIYIGNGHAAWEAALANTCSRGDLLLVLATGRFANGWSEMAQKMGVTVEIMDFGMDAPVDPDRVAERLRADTEGRIKAILSVHVDTSTSVRSDVAAISAARDAAGHGALLMSDCIASLGCDRFEMDDWGVDVMVAACQKGLMTPAGIAFVFFNGRADAARGDLVTAYWDWRPRVEPEGYWQLFDGTAPTHHLYGLRTALDMIHEEGIEAVWARHDTLARAIWAACERWAEGGSLRLNVTDRAHRSTAVTALCLPDGKATALRQWCETEAGLTLGIGLGREPADDWFRLGHMGHLNAHMVMGLLGSMAAGLQALKVPVGSGALDAATAVIAGDADF